MLARTETRSKFVRASFVIWDLMVAGEGEAGDFSPPESETKLFFIVIHQSGGICWSFEGSALMARLCLSEVGVSKASEVEGSSSQ